MRLGGVPRDQAAQALHHSRKSVSGGALAPSNFVIPLGEFPLVREFPYLGSGARRKALLRPSPIREILSKAFPFFCSSRLEAPLNGSTANKRTRYVRILLFFCVRVNTLDVGRVLKTQNCCVRKDALDTTRQREPGRPNTTNNGERTNYSTPGGKGKLF